MRKIGRSKVLNRAFFKLGSVIFTAVAVLVGVVFKSQIKNGIVGAVSKVDESLGTKVDSLIG